MGDSARSDPPQGYTYAGAGVDIDAGNRLVERIRSLVRSTARPGADSEIGGFGGVFDPRAAGFRDPVLVAANDGVGTKVKIATETGIHDSIGIDLVAMCVNDLAVQGAEPLCFLDYFAAGRLDLEVAAAVIEGIAKGCRQAGAALVGGETAEMPGLYRDGEYDLAGFSVGAVERGALLPRRDIESGDRILGLVSSGAHSNGFSLIRKLIADNRFDLDDPAPFAPGLSLGEALLVPTRIYVRAMLAALRQAGGIKAFAHITGGGLPENVPRVLPRQRVARIALDRIPVLPVFRWLAGLGAIEEREMLRTFNCGIGMVAVVEPQRAAAVTDAFEEAGETVIQLGEIVPGEGAPRIETSGALDISW